MNYKIKRFIAASLIGFTAVATVPSIALADSNIGEVQQLVTFLVDEKVANEMTLYAIEKNNINLSECSRLKNIFDIAYAERDIVFENGEIVVNESLRDKISANDYDTIVSDMELMNDSIELGIVSFSQIAGSFVTADIETFLSNLPDNDTNLVKEINNARILNFNLGGVVSENYAYIENYFNTQMTYNPSGAYTVTLALWVEKVREGGDWDYKRVYPPYDTKFTCTYGLNGSKTGIRTSEFIGNYNYGYTGSILFDLTILKTGSFVVSGFNPNDYNDHPAIEEGFVDANTIE